MVQCARHHALKKAQEIVGYAQLPEERWLGA
jgi:hypothetical protein